MKKLFILGLLPALALVFFLGSAGGYEAGKLSLGAFLGCSAGSAAVLWASFYCIERIERGSNGKKRK